MTDDHTELDDFVRKLAAEWMEARKDGETLKQFEKELEAYIQQRELAARVDEINELPLQVHSTHATRNYMCVSNRYVRNRLAALKHSQEGK